MIFYNLKDLYDKKNEEIIFQLLSYLGNIVSPSLLLDCIFCRLGSCFIIYKDCITLFGWINWIFYPTIIIPGCPCLNSNSWGLGIIFGFPWTCWPWITRTNYCPFWGIIIFWRCCTIGWITGCIIGCITGCPIDWIIGCIIGGKFV